MHDVGLNQFMLKRADWQRNMAFHIKGFQGSRVWLLKKDDFFAIGEYLVELE